MKWHFGLIKWPPDLSRLDSFVRCGQGQSNSSKRTSEGWRLWVEAVEKEECAGKKASNHLESIKLLSFANVLEPLADKEINWLAQNTTERSFDTGDIVYTPADACMVIFLVLTGAIRIYGMMGRQELTFDVFRTGAIFGEASLMARTQDEYAQALEPSRVGLLNRTAFWHLVSQHPEVKARLVRLLGDRLRRSRSRMTDIALKGVPARLASLILDHLESEGVVTREGHYKIPARYTQEQLATMIGAKRVAVSKAFGKLQDAGCVRLWRRQIYVVDLAALESFATPDY